MLTPSKGPSKTLSKPIRFVFISLIITILLFVYLKQTGKDQALLMTAVGAMMKPSQDPSEHTLDNKLDYSLDDNWLSLPERKDEADLMPEGVEGLRNDGSAPVDVFYIHGTGYLNNASWTAPIKQGTATEDNGRFSLANEASIFNACCNIYAPNFREASIFAYMSLSVDERDRLLNTVYIDIANAFAYFLAHHNNGRPFIIVSHSQGTHLALRLLTDIDKQAQVADNVVAVYAIGSGPVSLTGQQLDNFTHFHVCSAPSDTSCLVHWDSYGEHGTEKLLNSPEQSICVNPLSWRTDENKISLNKHLGAVPISGAYTMKLVGDDASNNVTFFAPEKPMRNYTWAQCRDGFLYVADQSGKDYEKLGKLPDKSYHGIDLPLFHMDIRHNAKQRIDAYFNTQVN